MRAEWTVSSWPMKTILLARPDRSDRPLDRAVGAAGIVDAGDLVAGLAQQLEHHLLGLHLLVAALDDAGDRDGRVVVGEAVAEAADPLGMGAVGEAVGEDDDRARAAAPCAP